MSSIKNIKIKSEANTSTATAAELEEGAQNLSLALGDAPSVRSSTNRYARRGGGCFGACHPLGLPLMMLTHVTTIASTAAAAP